MPRLRTIERKLSRARDARGLLRRTLAAQLIMEGQITTSKPRAKVVLPLAERLTSRAKRGDLTARRYVLAHLNDVEATHRLVDVIAPQMKRDSGFIRLKNAPARVGDGSPQATLSFVDEIKDVPVPAKTVKKPAARPKTTASKAKAAKPAAKKKATIKKAKP